MTKEWFLYCINPVNQFNKFKMKFINYKNRKIHELLVKYSYKVMSNSGGDKKIPAIYDNYTSKVEKYSEYNYNTLNSINAVINAIHKIYGLGWKSTHVSSIEVKTNDFSDNLNKFVSVFIGTEFPGMIIGKSGKDIDSLTKELTNIFGIETRIYLIESDKLVKTFSYNF